MALPIEAAFTRPMLQGAAAAGAKVGTRRIDATGTGGQQFDQVAGPARPTRRTQPNPHSIAGDGERNVQRTLCGLGHAVPLAAEEGDLDGRKGFVGRRPARAAPASSVMPDHGAGPQ